METFTIKNWRTDEILCEGEAENFKEFVQINKGNLKDANLKFTNLEDANIKGAYLEGAYLGRANLKGANLEDTNLEGANLDCANLSNANLSNANLEGANLKDTNLKGAYLQDSIIPIYSKRNISIRLPNPSIEKQDINKIKVIIGCKTKTITEWDEWFASDKEFETKRGTFEFKQIQAMYKAYRAYIIELWS